MTTARTSAGSRVCLWCKLPIDHLRPDAKFCNSSCRGKYWRATHDDPRTRITRKEAPVIEADTPLEWLRSKPIVKMCEYFAQPGVEFKKFSKAQVGFFLDFVNEAVPVWIGITNRGGAKTFLGGLGNLYFLDKYGHTGWKPTMLSGSEEQVLKMYKYVRYGLEEIYPDLLLTGKTKRLGTPLIEDGEVKCLLCSETSTRSGRTSILTIDEFCQAKNKVIKSAYGQVVTASTLLLRFTGTPDDPQSIVHEYWDEHEKLGIKRYHFSWRECPHILWSTVKRLKALYSEDEFMIEMEGEWRSRTGNVFNIKDVEATQIDRVPVTAKFANKRIAIDVGDRWHYTVATVLGQLAGTEIWYVLDVKSFKKVHYESIVAEIKDLWLANDRCAVVIEDSSVAKEMQRLIGEFYRFKEADLITFTKHKDEFIAHLAYILENKLLKIPRKFMRLHVQLRELHYDKRGKVAKVNDDYVDSLMYGLGKTTPKLILEPVLTFEAAGFDPGSDYNVFY